MATRAFLDPFGAFAAEPHARVAAWAAPRPLCYRTLVGRAWGALPARTRARFERHEACYEGTITLKASAAGRVVERLSRLVGAPLPPAHTAPLAATVRVLPDPATGGSRWVRSYVFPRRVVSIASTKALDRDGTLVERLAFGLRMRLEVSVRAGALYFDSAGYYVDLPGIGWQGRRYGAWRVPLPRWFLPGHTTVVHRDLGGGDFRFTMTIRHTLLGELFAHDGVFHASGEAS